MVMADVFFFMAAVVYHIRLVLALLPSHLFLFAVGGGLGENATSSATVDA
jgi:hypothetical protein